MPHRLNNTDPELGRFMEEYVDSFVKWDLISFFCTNPGTRATPAELSRYLGRQEKDILEALEDLAGKGLFEKAGQDPPTYAFAPTKELGDVSMRFVRCLDERGTRLKVLHKLLTLRPPGKP